MRGEVSDNACQPGVGVVRVHGEYRLLSVAHFRPGEFLFEIAGEITRTPTRYTVQIDRNAHIDLNDSHNLEEILDRYYWRFMNHSCEPNTVIRGRNVVALRPIHPWEEITFNYNTTEYQMAEPFQCRCESHGCEETIRGFAYLSAAEQERLRPLLAPYLLCLLDEGPIELPAANPPEGGPTR